MGKFDHYVGTGMQLYKNGARDFDTWSDLMIDEVGPAVKPFLFDIMKCSLVMLEKISLNNKRLKKNCWEFKFCRRQIGNERQQGEVTCTTFQKPKLNGIYGGNNGGSACWVVPETPCDSKVQSSSFHILFVCRSCEFYQAVRDKEGLNFNPAHRLVKMLVRWFRKPPNKNQGACFEG
jgi:hypothetical protein